MVRTSAGKKYRSCIFGRMKGRRSTEKLARNTVSPGVIRARLEWTARAAATTTAAASAVNRG